MEYNYDNEPVVYENDFYVVKTGIYPGEEIKCYLVINKQFNIVEYAHSIWYFCKKWADNFQDVMSKPSEAEVEESELPDLFGPST